MWLGWVLWLRLSPRLPAAKPAVVSNSAGRGARDLPQARSCSGRKVLSLMGCWTETSAPRELSSAAVLPQVRAMWTSPQSSSPSGSGLHSSERGGPEGVQRHRSLSLWESHLRSDVPSPLPNLFTRSQSLGPAHTPGEMAQVRTPILTGGRVRNCLPHLD